jgi:hypothetical protein
MNQRRRPGAWSMLTWRRRQATPPTVVLGVAFVSHVLYRDSGQTLRTRARRNAVQLAREVARWEVGRRIIAGTQAPRAAESDQIGACVQPRHLRWLALPEAVPVRCGPRARDLGALPRPWPWWSRECPALRASCEPQTQRHRAPDRACRRTETDAPTRTPTWRPGWCRLAQPKIAASSQPAVEPLESSAENTSRKP